MEPEDTRKQINVILAGDLMKTVIKYDIIK